MPSLCIRLFGTPQISIDGAPIYISRDKSLALLIYLSISNTPQRRDRLSALLWPHHSQSSARAYLRNTLYTLKHSLGQEWFQTDRKQIALNSDMDLRTDVAQFAELVAVWEKTNSCEALIDAVSLAQDEFAAGFGLPDSVEFDEWLLYQRESLRREVDYVLSTLIDQYGSDGQFDLAMEYAQRRVAMDPLNESAQRSLIWLYASTGQKAAALRQFGELEALLRQELDADPSDNTLDLYEEIRLDRIKGRSSPSSTLSSVQSSDDNSNRATAALPTHNIPQPPTPLVGRQMDLDELDRLLVGGDTRLVTIVGPGGMGKTRLAIACALRQLDGKQLADDVHYVTLAPVDEVSQIAPTIAAAVGCVLQPGDEVHTPARQLGAYLTGNRLLILDNFEHLIAGASLVRELLDAAPQLHILVTSRERLDVQYETVYPIWGLALGSDDGSRDVDEPEAVSLFMQCARRSAPNLTIAAEDRSQIAAICQLVEGMPLGIELAASWIGSLSPSEIVTEIECNLDFLATSMPDVPDRHQSIRVVFDSTWRRLDVEDQKVFAALSVFRGGFTRESASVVAGVSLHQLRRLVEQSLIQPHQQRPNDVYRYTVHPLLRQYAAEKLDHMEELYESIGSRYIEYYANFLEQRLPRIHGPQQAQAITDIQDEMDNMRAMWQQAIARRDAQALNQSATTYFLFCQHHSLFLEGAEAMSEAAACLRPEARSDLRDRTLAQVLNHEGWLWMRMGSFDHAKRVLEESRTLYVESGIAPPPHMGSDPASPLAIVAQSQGEYDVALQLADAALADATRRDDVYNQIYAHYALASSYTVIGDLDAARHHARHACEKAQSQGNYWFSAIVLNEWARADRAAGDLVNARNHFEQSYQIMHSNEDSEGMAVVLNGIGEVALLENDLPLAKSDFQQAFELYADTNDRVGSAFSMLGLARIALIQDDLETATTQFLQVREIATETGFVPLQLILLVHAGDLLCAYGESTIGLWAVQYAYDHPAVYYEIKQRAEDVLSRWHKGDIENTNYIDYSVASDGNLNAIISFTMEHLSALKSAREVSGAGTRVERTTHITVDPLI